MSNPALPSYTNLDTKLSEVLAAHTDIHVTIHAHAAAEHETRERMRTQRESDMALGLEVSRPNA
jgi:hypothetical protein